MLTKAKQKVVEQTYEATDPSLHKKLTKGLIKVNPSYAQTFANIQKERIENGEEPLFSPEEMEEVMQYVNIQESQETIFTPDLSIESFALGSTGELSDGTQVTIVENLDGEKFLDLGEGVVLSPLAASNAQIRERRRTEAIATGLNFLSADEQFQFLDTVNEVISR